MKTRNYQFSTLIQKAGLFLLLAATAILITSCKASVEGETKKWAGNLEMVDRLAGEYPNYAAPLNEVKANAEGAWKAAEALTDEEKKAEAMNAANDIIDNSFAQKLGEMPIMMDEISKIRGDLSGKKMSQTLISKLKSAAEKADEAVDDAYDAMSMDAGSIAAAESNISPAYSALKSSRDKWKTLKSDYSKEQKDKQSKK